MGGHRTNVAHLSVSLRDVEIHAVKANFGMKLDKFKVKPTHPPISRPSFNHPSRDMYVIHGKTRR